MRDNTTLNNQFDSTNQLCQKTLDIHLANDIVEYINKLKKESFTKTTANLNLKTKV